jgi:peroxiredoxin
VGRRTLARNAVLLALAIWIGGAGAGDSVSTPWLVAIAAGVLALAEAALGLDLLRENRRLRARPEPPPAPGLPVGTPAPDFELEGVDGRRQMLLAGAGPWLLVFTDARCAPCDALMPALARWQQRLRLVIVASGDPERNRAEASEHGLELRLLLQREREVADAYRAPGTPMAVLVDQERHIASATVASGEAIAALVAETIGPESLTRGAGDPVPPLRLPDLDGRPRALADLCAEPTLLIFWSPGCERCQKMLLGLRTLEQELHATGPKLLVISDGDAAEIRAQGLPGTVLIDPDRRAMTEFGARGTPMSVLLADGRVASPLAAGAAGLVDLLDAVFARS